MFSFVSLLALVSLTLGDAVPAGKSHVRVIHGVYDVNVDLLAGDEAIEFDLAFGDITDFIEVDAGINSFGIRAAGTTEDPVAEATLELEERHRYSVAAVMINGTVELRAADQGKYQPHNGSPLFVWHLSEDAPAIQLDIGDTNLPADGLAFGDHVTILDATPDLTSVDVVVNEDKSVVFSGVNPGLKAGVATSLFALGSLEAGVATVATMQDMNKLYLGVATELFATVGVRFVHGFPADVPVDIWYSETSEPTVTLAEGVEFGAITDHIPLPATDLKVWVALAGTTTFLIDGADVPLSAGADRLTIVVEPDMNGDATVAIVNDATYDLVEPAAYKVTAVHAVAGAPAVSIKVKDADMLLAANVSYGSSAVVHMATTTNMDNQFEVPMQVVAAADGTTVLAEFNASLNRATEVLVVLAGNLTDDSEAYGGVQFFTSSSSISYLRGVHAAFGAPEVRLAIDYETYGSVSYMEASGFVAVSAAEHTVELITSDDVGAYSVTRECTVGAFWSVIAYMEEDVLAVWNLENDPQTPAMNNSHVQVLHAAQAPPVEVQVDSAPIGSVETGEAIPYTPLPAGSYSVDLVLNGTDQVALNVPSLAVEAHMAYSVVAMGDAGAGASAETELTVVAYGDALVRDDSALTPMYPIPSGGDDGEGEGEGDDGEGEGEGDDGEGEGEGDDGEGDDGEGEGDGEGEDDDDSDSDSDDDDANGAVDDNDSATIALSTVLAAFALGNLVM